MPRYKLTIAYDGTNFCGWQKQEPHAHQDAPDDRGQDAGAQGTARPVPAEKVVEELPPRPGEEQGRLALRTVQHVVEQAVIRVVRERIVLDGASRTDAGVHARGQVAAFTCSDGEDTPERTGWPESRGVERLVRAINGSLPDDVVVTDARVVPESFDPVRDATSKGYSYTILNARERALWDRNYVQHIHDELDASAMRAAAAHFVGEHDFAAFAAANHGRLTTIRTVFSCEVSASPLTCGLHSCGRAGAEGGMPRLVRIDVSGSGFLYNMVRIIAGTLVEVGRGRMSPDAIPSIIAGKDRRAAGPTLPGRGLCLEWIRY